VPFKAGLTVFFLARITEPKWSRWKNCHQFGYSHEKRKLWREPSEGPIIYVLMGYATLSPEPSNYPAAMAAVLDFLLHICSFWKDFIIWQIRKHNWLNSYVEFPNDTKIRWRVIQVIVLPSLVTFARVISEKIIGKGNCLAQVKGWHIPLKRKWSVPQMVLFKVCVFRVNRRMVTATKHTLIQGYIGRVIQVIVLPSLVTFARVISEKIIGMWKSNVRKLQITTTDPNWWQFFHLDHFGSVMRAKKNTVKPASLRKSVYFFEPYQKMGCRLDLTTCTISCPLYTG
jgi:hypothetical protein